MPFVFSVGIAPDGDEFRFWRIDNDSVAVAVVVYFSSFSMDRPTDKMFEEVYPPKPFLNVNRNHAFYRPKT